MQTNTIKFKKDVRNKILKGVETVATAVTSTLGPGGRNVMIETTNGGTPVVTKDGVSVAKSICLEDNFENMGAKMVIEVASKTNTSCGDGTTTATLLAYEMYKNAAQVIDECAVEPQDAKRGMLEVLDKVKDFVKSSTITVETEKDIRHVANISSNGDTEISEIVTEVINETGTDGIVVVQEGQDLKTTRTITKGMRLDSGFMSALFCNSIDGKPLCVLENAYILFYEKKINNMNDLFPIMDKVAKKGCPLFIVAEDYDADVISTVLANHLRGILKACMIKAPGVMENIRKDVLTDAAISTGGTLICPEIGIALADVTLDMLGRADKIEIGTGYTTFIGGKANEEKFNQRVLEIKSMIEDDSITPYMKHICKERLAKLSGGIAIIKVGGETQSIIKEKRDRIDDALCATREAKSGGIVSGGGITLFKAGMVLMENKIPTDSLEFAMELLCSGVEKPEGGNTEGGTTGGDNAEGGTPEGGTTEGDQNEQPNGLINYDRDSYISKVGTAIVGPALLEPFRKILSNAGISNIPDVATVIEEFKKSADKSKCNCGINVRTIKYEENLIDAGVIDPANVTLSAVTNAISVAALLISTDCMIGLNKQTEVVNPNPYQMDM